jgi:hypothetical protein
MPGSEPDRCLVRVLRALSYPLDRVYAHNWIDYKDARYCEGCALAKMAREWGEWRRAGISQVWIKGAISDTIQP